MKRLLESFRKYLEEETDAQQWEKWLGFNPNEVSSAKFDFQKNGFEYIHGGSWREAWNIPSRDDVVLKILRDCYDSRGQKMNQMEARAAYQTKYPEFVPKVYLASKDYCWMIVEKVTPFYYDPDAEKEIFPVLTNSLDIGFSSDDLHRFMRLLMHKQFDMENYLTKKERLYPLAYRLVARNGEYDKFLDRVAAMLLEFEGTVWDLNSLNTGYVVRNGKKQFVVQDPGMDLIPDGFRRED